MMIDIAVNACEIYFLLLWPLQMAGRKLEIWQMVCHNWTVKKQFSSVENVFESPLYHLNMEEITREWLQNCTLGVARKGGGEGHWASVVGKKQLYKLKLCGFSFQMLVYSRLF